MILNILYKEALEKNSYLFESTELCEIMGRNKSDKGNIDLTKSHNYTTLYFNLFKDLKDKHLNIFELGLGTNNTDVRSNMGVFGRPGASLFGWSEFFPNSFIYGADIDSRILFESDRIKTFYCDQTDPESIKKMWNNEILKEVKFDIIVEDGLHALNAQICFFENSIHKVKDGGYYIIEDFNHGESFNKMCNYFKGLQNSSIYHNLSVDIYQLPATSDRHKLNGNNSLVVIKKQNTFDIYENHK